MSDASGVTDTIARFKTDLAELSVNDLVRKYVTTGSPAALSEDQYFSLRKVIAEEFQLHPSAVVLVGSCRTGFSISPKKRYTPVRARSDLDIALISSERFDQYWDDVFEYASSDIAWRRSEEGREFSRSLFNGWIDPRGLPSVPRFISAGKWAGFFDQLMRTRQFGRRRISARLYRSWARLEAYQAKAVEMCIAELDGGSDGDQPQN
jgi:hypothetical protein